MQINLISAKDIESLFLLRFGKRKYLEKIGTEGLRFTKLDKYKNYPGESDLINDEHESEIHLNPDGIIISVKIEDKYKPLEGLKDCIKKSNIREFYKICCFSIPKIEITHKTEKEIFFKLSPKYIQDIKNNFPFPDYDAAVMILRSDLENVFEERLTGKVRYAPVNYYDEKSLNFSDIMFIANEKTIFYKRIKYSQQREYRAVIIDHNTREYLTLNRITQPTIIDMKDMNDSFEIEIY